MSRCIVIRWARYGHGTHDTRRHGALGPAGRGTRPRGAGRPAAECEGRVRTPDRRQSHAHNGKPHAHRRSRRRDTQTESTPTSGASHCTGLESYNHRGLNHTTPDPYQTNTTAGSMSVPSKRTCRMIYSGRHGRQRTHPVSRRNGSETEATPCQDGSVRRGRGHREREEGRRAVGQARIDSR